MRQDSAQTAPSVAVYWDFENVHASLYEEEAGSYREARYKAQAELLNVAAIMDFVSSIGSVCVSRAYCNWCYFQRYQDALSTHGIELVQLFPKGQHGKNGADIHMSVDIMEDLARRPHIDVFVLVSGDSDFIGVAQKIRQYGKQVIGIGVRNRTNRFFQRVCDEFKFYESLLQQEMSAPVSADASGKLSMAAAKQLLVAAVSRLATQFGDPAVRKGGLKPMMLRLEPAFDERGLGFANFSAFIAACQDVVEETAGRDDHLIRVKSGAASVVPGETTEAMASARKCLVHTLSLLGKRSEEPVTLSALKSTMLRIDAGFDEKKLNAKTFTAFLQKCPDLVAIEGEGERKTVKLLVPPDDGGHSLPAKMREGNGNGSDTRPAENGSL